MGLFPTKITEADKEDKGGRQKSQGQGRRPNPRGGKKGGGMNINIKIPGLGGGVKPKVLTTFTRQLATLVDAGLPLLRGLRVLEKQERNANLKKILGELATSIEGGSTFSEALAQHPKVFNRLFVNMVKAGELGGVLEVVLKRLAEFSEKAQKIKGKVKAAMFYPIAVMIVAGGHHDFADVLRGAEVQGRVRGMGIENAVVHLFVMGVSDMIKNNILGTMGAMAVLVVIVSAVSSRRNLAADSGTSSSSRCRRPAGHQQGGHLPFHAHAGHARQQRCADFAGADHRQGNRRQCHHRQRRRQGP
jgi:type IV pilus assembly protein PilC